jgi:hypothetical protein
MLSRQQQVARVSQFQMPRIESGGTIEVCLAGGELFLGTFINSEHCDRTGCCKLERLYLAEVGYGEVLTECLCRRIFPNVFLDQSTGQHGMCRIYLSKCDPCPTPESSKIAGPDIFVDPALTMCWPVGRSSCPNSKEVRER